MTTFWDEIVSNALAKRDGAAGTSDIYTRSAVVMDVDSTTHTCSVRTSDGEFYNVKIPITAYSLGTGIFHTPSPNDYVTITMDSRRVPYIQASHTFSGELENSIGKRLIVPTGTIVVQTAAQDGMAFSTNATTPGINLVTRGYFDIRGTSPDGTLVAGTHYDTQSGIQTFTVPGGDTTPLITKKQLDAAFGALVTNITTAGLAGVTAPETAGTPGLVTQDAPKAVSPAAGIPGVAEAQQAVEVAQSSVDQAKSVLATATSFADNLTGTPVPLPMLIKSRELAQIAVDNLTPTMLINKLGYAAATGVLVKTTAAERAYHAIVDGPRAALQGVQDALGFAQAKVNAINAAITQAIADKVAEIESAVQSAVKQGGDALAAAEAAKNTAIKDFTDKITKAINDINAAVSLAALIEGLKLTSAKADAISTLGLVVAGLIIDCGPPPLGIPRPTLATSLAAQLTAATTAINSADVKTPADVNILAGKWMDDITKSLV